MGKKVWEKCTICNGSGKAFPGSDHDCGGCWGKKGKWVIKDDGSSNGGCKIAGLFIVAGVLYSIGFGVSKALATAGLF